MSPIALRTHCHTLWDTVHKHAPLTIATCAVGVVAQRFFGTAGLFVFVASCASAYAYSPKIQEFLSYSQNYLSLIVGAGVAPFFGFWGVLTSAVITAAYTLKEALFTYKVRANLEESFKKIEDIETAFSKRASERETLFQAYKEKNEEITHFWEETKKEIDSSHTAFTNETDQFEESITKASSALDSTAQALNGLDALTLEYEVLNEKINNALANNEETVALIQNALNKR